MKDNLGQECVKGALRTFQGKIETTAPDFPGKMTVFSSFDPTFPPVPPYNLTVLPKRKVYFGMSNNRAISWKSFIMLSLRLWIW